MKKNIRAWNQRSVSEEEDKTSNVNVNKNSTRERITSTDQDLEDMETSLKLYDDSHFVHAFIVPNYAEPEALLRDTIKRIANHK